MAGEMTDELAEAILYGLWGTETVAVVTGQWVLTGTQPCPSCGPGRCDGSTQDCTLDSYYANPANGPRPSAGTAQNPAPPRPCPGCNTSPCKGGYSQCSAFRGYGWGMWPGYTPSYPATRYDDSPPTEWGPAPAPDTRPRICPCGIDRRDCDYHR